MAKKPTTQKSPLDEIIDEMLKTLEAHDEFDSVTLERLRRIAANGNLDKTKRVEDSIRSVPERKQ